MYSCIYLSIQSVRLFSSFLADPVSNGPPKTLQYIWELLEPFGKEGHQPDGKTGGALLYLSTATIIWQISTDESDFMGAWESSQGTVKTW